MPPPVFARFTSLKRTETRIKYEHVTPEVLVYMRKWITDLRKEAREYPDYNPYTSGDSEYERTNTLYNSWKIDGPKLTYDGYSVKLTSQALDKKSGRPYSGFVVGEQQTKVLYDYGWIKLSEFYEHSTYRAGLQAIYNKIKIV